jgi:glycosyltransferase involved in cell wall biosynthesis
MYKIAAVVCTYQRYDVLPKAIESLKKQTLSSEDYRIIIIDNSPDWEYAEKKKLEYQEPPFIEYVIEKIPGLSNARNVGARICGTDYIAYMDDDAIASPSWLENIIQAFELFGDEAAVVGGRVDPLWEEARPSWLDDSLLCYLSVVNWGGETRIAGKKEWFAGTNIAFRTDEILNHGGFDVSLGRTGGSSVLLSNEEINLLDKIKENGKLTIYAPNAVVSHLAEKRRLQRSWFRQRMAWQAISDYRMDPEKAQENAKKSWDFVMDYFFGLPPKERNIRGLYHDTYDPKLFCKQLSVLYTFTIMTMAGFAGVEGREELQ